MAKKSMKSVTYQIVDLLDKKGPMSKRDLKQHIEGKSKTVDNKVLNLKNEHRITEDDDHLLHLADGVTPESILSTEVNMTNSPDDTPEDEENEGEDTPETSRAPAGLKDRSAGAVRKAEGITGDGRPLDQRQQFIDHMISIGVAPRDAIPTIADIFFSGDIENLDWMAKVLATDAQGFVTKRQRRLMMSWWANTRDLNFDPSEFGLEAVEEKKTGAKGAQPGEEEPVRTRPVDPGIGWKIEKDRDGDWIATPGGPMEYRDAVEAAERRQVLAAYNVRTHDDEEDEGDDEQPRAGKRGTVKRQPDPFQLLMVKFMEKMMDNVTGGGKGESEVVQKLTARIEQMEADKVEERFERLEGMLAQSLTRDPWEDPSKFAERAKALGYERNVVTDQSPAVQLIKDSTDKMDKNFGRLFGLVERVALRSDAFQPEQTRTPEERDKKAGELLHTVTDGTAALNARRRLIGR